MKTSVNPSKEEHSFFWYEANEKKGRSFKNSLKIQIDQEKHGPFVSYFFPFG